MATGSPALSGPAPRPVLVLGWGNRSRGADALGPELLDRLQRWLETAHPARAHQVDWLEDYQLQIEHTLDLKDRRAVLLLDAAVGLDTPVAWRTVQPRRDRSLSTHALSPETLLQIFEDVHGQPAPPCELLLMQAQIAQCKDSLTELTARAGIGRAGERSSMPFPQWMEGLVTAWQSTHPNQDLDWTWAPRLKRARFYPDPELEQIIRTLLFSARPSSGTGHIQHLSARDEGEEVVLEVSLPPPMDAPPRGR